MAVSSIITSRYQLPGAAVDISTIAVGLSVALSVDTMTVVVRIVPVAAGAGAAHFVAGHVLAIAFDVQHVAHFDVCG